MDILNKLYRVVIPFTSFRSPYILSCIMTLPQQKFREAVFITLFAHAVGGGSPATPDLVAEQLKISKKYAGLALSRVHALLDQKETIDSKIREKSTEYDFDRIPEAEKNILRLALFEMVYDAGIPHKVSIAEALRLAKKFCTSSAVKFINALLDVLYKELNGHQAAV